MFRDMRGTSSNKYSPQLYIYKVYWKKNRYDKEIIIKQKNIDRMKKLIAIAFALVPCLCMAQGDWEKPVKQNQEAKKALFSKNPANEDPKYLEGAVPTVDGKVVFTLDKDVPGKDAQQIYDIVHRYEKALQLVGEEVRAGNPSPGNKAGGLTTLEEKSLGCIHKGGHTAVNAVYDYAKQVEAKKGLVIMDTPGNDPSSVAGMVAGGAMVFIWKYLGRPI
jgi:hypothetical protein